MVLRYPNKPKYMTSVMENIVIALVVGLAYAVLSWVTLF